MFCFFCQIEKLEDGSPGLYKVTAKMNDGTEVVGEYNTVSSGMMYMQINTLRPRQNGRHFADDIFECIFLNENVCIPIKISLKFVP